jgi:hypothetical protein
MALLPLIRDDVVALVMMALPPSSSLHFCPHCNGVVIIINVIALVAHWQAGVVAVNGQVCHCCDGNCCSCHDGIIAVVDAQACIRHSRASILTLVACL